MIERAIKIPGPDHPITIERNRCRVIVTLDGQVIADTREALTLREANYPPVQYIPRKDVDMAALTRTETTTFCPYKGEAAYYSIPAGGERSVDAIWTYEAPYDAVIEIKDYLAFYPDRVDAIEQAFVAGFSGRPSIRPCHGERGRLHRGARQLPHSDGL